MSKVLDSPEKQAVLGDTLLSILPGSGEVISAQDSVNFGRKIHPAIEEGRFGDAASNTLLSLVSAAGALPIVGSAIRGARGVTKAIQLLPQPTKLNPDLVKFDSFKGLARKVKESDGPDLVRDVVQQNDDDVSEVLRHLVKGDRGPTTGELNSMQKQIHAATQRSLKDFPDTMTVYRVGDLRGEEAVSFTVNPKFQGKSLPWVSRTNPDAPLVAYQVEKRDILAAPNAILRAGKGSADEQEVIISGLKVLRID